MPNYWYKCGKCKATVEKSLPISTDPKKRFECECGYLMKRIIRPGAQFPKEVGKVWAGDWFKKTYGTDIGEEARRKADNRMRHDAEILKAEQDGIKLNHKSRQVGGDKRISIPDKKDD